jgi:diguanylate cyclase (GGDEF)-like protein
MVAGDELVGVVSLYSQEQNGFNDDHRRIVEVVAQQIAPALQRTGSRASVRDVLTGLPGILQLEQLLLNDQGRSATCALVSIDIVNLKQINQIHGHSAGDDALRHVARQAQSSLRVGDILFRTQSDEFVALLPAAATDAANGIARRIKQAVSDHPLPLPGDISVQIAATVRIAITSGDRASMDGLLAAIRKSPVPAQVESSVH